MISTKISTVIIPYDGSRQWEVEAKERLVHEKAKRVVREKVERVDDIIYYSYFRKPLYLLNCYSSYMIRGVKIAKYHVLAKFVAN